MRASLFQSDLRARIRSYNCLISWLMTWCVSELEAPSFAKDSRFLEVSWRFEESFMYPLESDISHSRIKRTEGSPLIMFTHGLRNHSGKKRKEDGRPAGQISGNHFQVGVE
jgi:hypothetical protein